MSWKQDKINIAQKIEAAAQLYKQELVGKRFLYIFDGRYIEVLFKAENFRHLTGVNTNLSAASFFKYAVNGKLGASQIWFDSVHPFSLCVRKIQHIEDVAAMAASECFMLEDISTDKAGYKFGTTDLKFTLCLNKDNDRNGNEKGDCYVVQSLRDEDCFSKSQNVYVVTHILSKRNDEKQYNAVLYVDEKTKQQFPGKIKPMLTEECCGQLMVDQSGKA